jgi:ribonuclease P protein component
MTERHQEQCAKEPSNRPPQRLVRRAEFLAAAKGQRFHSLSFSLQAVSRKQPEAADPASEIASSPPRFGFTATKKIGNAVLRNRIRRRLKEALRLASDLPARPGHDYVIVARHDALSRNFGALQDELKSALATVGRSPKGYRGKGKARSGDRHRPAADDVTLQGNGNDGPEI